MRLLDLELGGGAGLLTCLTTGAAAADVTSGAEATDGKLDDTVSGATTAPSAGNIGVADTADCTEAATGNVMGCVTDVTGKPAFTCKVGCNNNPAAGGDGAATKEPGMLEGIPNTGATPATILGFGAGVSVG